MERIPPQSYIGKNDITGVSNFGLAESCDYMKKSIFHFGKFIVIQNGDSTSCYFY